MERILAEAGISRNRMKALIACGVLTPRRPKILKAKYAYFLREEVLGVIEKLTPVK
jgi:hypothetical protein